MTATLDILRFGRNAALATFDGLTVEQINAVPKTFNNNLIWNVAHVIVVQQNICYKRTNQKPHVDETMIATYTGGTAPHEPLTPQAIDQFKVLASSTLDQLETDIKDGLFTAFAPFTLTNRNIPIATIDNILQFLVYHEGMHVGHCKDIRRAVLAG